jgi:hypothetical protein
VTYPIPKKSDAAKCYRRFEEAWNQTGTRIGYPRCGSAKEFLSSEVKFFFLPKSKLPSNKTT